MHAPVGHQAAGVIPEPTEIKMKTVRIKMPFGRGAKPEFVIHAGGRITVRHMADARQPVEKSPRTREADLAKLAGADEFRGLDDVRGTAPLRTHLHDAVESLRSFKHRAAFINCFGQRFLGVNILP